MAYHINIPNITLAFHGCEREVGLRLLEGDAFRPSVNAYDWLGEGIYFWELNPKRARSFIVEQMKRRKDVKEAFVVGAAISLGNCIDTLSENCLVGIEEAYQKLKYLTKAASATMPTNSGGDDKLVRELDCSVIRTLHTMIEDLGHPKVDSLRGLYQEGGELYPGAGFYKKSHIQLCILNPECIKGVFRVKPEDII